MPENGTPAADNERDLSYQDHQPDESYESYERISGRAMLLLGGVSTLAAVVVLALTLVIAPGARDADGSRDPGRAAPAGPGAPGRVEVPDVAGLEVMEAVNRLAVARIPLGGVIRVPSSREAGQIVRSYPPGGRAVRGGVPVTLYVSAGVGGSVAGSEVTVPYLVGLDAQRARATAAGLGLRVQVAAGGTTVAGQRPEPGSVRPRGSTITLTLR
jgi:hypothetical protein